MKRLINVIINTLFAYVVFHLLPWPTVITIYGSLLLCIHFIAIIAVFYFMYNPHKFTKRYTNSIIYDFILAITSIIIYLTSPHEVAQYLAITITVIFFCIYFIRYKTQQLF